MRKILGLLKLKHFGSPTVFDAAVITLVLTMPIFTFREYSASMMRNILFIFGGLAIFVLSITMEPKRKFKSQSLCALVLWSMFHVFYHSFKNAEFGLVWINWSLLNEGFIYILVGTVYIYTIVNYSSARGWYYIALLIGLGIAYRRIFGEDWSMTPIIAVLLSGIITLVLRFRNWKIAIAGFSSLLCLILYKWNYIWGVKWISRPDFWKATLSRFTFLGRGFYHTINTMRGFVAADHSEFSYVIQRWGIGWRQNDFLEFGEYVGIVGVVLLLWFIIGLIIGSKVGFGFF